MSESGRRRQREGRVAGPGPTWPLPGMRGSPAARTVKRARRWCGAG